MANEEKGEDWRAQVGENPEVTTPDIVRARETGRGHRAIWMAQMIAR